MSKYNSNADAAERQLNNLSPTMCFAKWAQVSINLTNGLTHSCYHPPAHKVNLEEIEKDPSALHNTQQKKQERKLMLSGKRPEGCSYCWKMEDQGNRSDRIYKSGEAWAQNSKKDIIDTLDTGSINPRYVEINFNQTCNLKCMYCSPHISSAWEDDIIKHGPISIADGKTGDQSKHNDLSYFIDSKTMPFAGRQADNPYLAAFWKWWPDLYKDLEVFRVTGGEPLLDSNFYQVLDYIYKNPNSTLEASITSNFCPPRPEIMNKFISKLKKLEEIQIWEDTSKFNPAANNYWYVNMALKNFTTFVSVDSVGAQAEYIRDGLTFDTLDKNVHRYLTETINTSITFINTFNILSLPKFKDFLIYILQLRQTYSKSNQPLILIPIEDKWTTHPDYEVHPRQRIGLDIPLLTSPAWQNINILPAEFSHYIEDGIKFMEQNSDISDGAGFYDFEIEKVKRNLRHMNSINNAKEVKIAQDNFVSFFDQYDKRRNLSFVDTFPEYSELYHEWRAARDR